MVVVAVAVAVVSQRESCVKLRKTLRNHVNEARGASSAAKLFALEISRFTLQITLGLMRGAELEFYQNYYHSHCRQQLL